MIVSKKKGFYTVIRTILFTLILPGCFIASSPLHAQDIHFSMFNASPLLLNPANTGNFDGDWRIAGNYRNQWLAISKTFRTAAVSFDKQIYFLNQKFSGGVYLVNDESGSRGLIFNKAYASLGYNRIINNNYLNFGLQLGYVYQAFDRNMTTPSQWNNTTGGFDPTLPTLEPNEGENRSYLDVNAGLLWKKNINIFVPEVGLAFFHLNSPNWSFYGYDEHQPIRFTLHTKVKTKLNDEIYLLPTLLYMRQKGATETIVGSGVGMNLFGNRSSVKEITGGLYLRNGFFNSPDAISLVGGATIRRIEVALSYDINISGLSQVTGYRGAFEISFIYKSISTVLNSYSIPCERL